MLAGYERLLARRPLAVKTVFGGVVACCGDATAQAIEQQRAPEESPRSYDMARGMALSSLGTFWNGPFLHYYFNALDRYFPQRPGDFRALLRKVAINQLIVNPLIYLPLFYMWTGAVVGRSATQTREKAEREGINSLLATWGIFTPVNLINFQITPLRHQTSVNVVVSFVYNTTLSLIAAPRPRDTK